MSTTEFAMVEELAFLIKDNLPCKHLVLSMEEAFISFLQDDPSSDRLLELEPMNPYNRLLLHRLADIFGFSHESVGEGEDRRLILERCPDSSVPSILVSDLLWQYDELSPEITSHQVLRRDRASPVLNKEKTNVQFSFEERQAEYMAARERIFARFDSENDEMIKQKPRSDPMVARRMIAHALGRNSRSSSTEAVTLEVSNISAEKTCEMNIQEEKVIEGSKKFRPRNRETKESIVLHAEKKSDSRQADTPFANKPGGVVGRGKKTDMKEENIGAAKRMFAHALRFQSSTKR